MSGSDSDIDQATPRKSMRRKRRKGNDGRATAPAKPPPKKKSGFTMQPLFDVLATLDDDNDNDGVPFEDSIEEMLPEFIRDRAAGQAKQSQVDAHGKMLRPLTRLDTVSLLSANDVAEGSWALSQHIAIRKLKLDQQRRQAKYADAAAHALPKYTPSYVEMEPGPPAAPTAVINALEAIQSTPYENSFLSRLLGSTGGADVPGLVSVDWETLTPWMNLMTDVREHYTLAHPRREHPQHAASPILYTSMQVWHLEQVHELLERTFWSGIDIRDSLDSCPERCTIIATYGRLVVGVAIMSSPRETYITYLAVRAGWEGCRIATTMLYHLLTRNPHQDFTVHVPTNSSAMLLFNRFGFDAEEFVAGFYEPYLDRQSRVSKNAFKLRLNQR
ncbi:Cytoplasmic protein [Mycena kentingensis (nom. inval.)]|nr:Cytoplasmic protein [Mycena kentingensis (nom. inval.)]